MNQGKRAGGWFVACVVAPGLWAAAQEVRVSNPYDSVAWESAVHARAQFHAHTTASDGSWNPHQVVDRYHRAGFRILAITDHDTHARGTTWPWEAFDRVAPSERSRSALERGEYRGQAIPSVRTMAGNLVYENRDPAELDMVAVQGNEITRVHQGLSCHVVSLFTDFWSADREMTDQLEGLARRNGLGILAHPALSWARGDRTLEEGIPDDVFQAYLELFGRFPALVGMEVINGCSRREHWAHDLILWDRLLGELMPGRPVWGMATDDFHSSQFGIGWAVIPLTRFDEASVRRAVERGAYSFSAVHAAGRPVPESAWEGVPVIQSVRHDPEAGTLTIRARVAGGPLDEQDCVWVGENGEPVHVGRTLAYRETPGIRNYVRAELRGPGGVTYTNPFGVSRR